MMERATLPIADIYVPVKRRAAASPDLGRPISALACQPSHAERMSLAKYMIRLNNSRDTLGSMSQMGRAAERYTFLLSRLLQSNSTP
jgi:hypothetical protein